MEESGTDLIEVEKVPGEVEENLGIDREKEGDLRSKSLTEKMIYLMEKISEYGYLTRLEVELIYANQTHAYKVLGTLRSKGLIGDFETEKQPKKAVYLKPKGYRTLEKFGRLRVKRRFLTQYFKPFIFVHRMACAKVGLVLEGHPLVREFLPESLLWERVVERRQKLCDGEFMYRTPDDKAEKVGLEVELTLKNRDKLDESLRQLRDRRDLAQVWWICGSETIMRAVKQEVTRRQDSKPRHLFCLMGEFLVLKQRTRLSDSEGAEFKIDPDEPTLRPAADAEEVAERSLAPAEATPQPKPGQGIGLDLESAIFPDIVYPPQPSIQEKLAVLYADLEKSRARQQAEAEAEERNRTLADKIRRRLPDLEIAAIWTGITAGAGVVALLAWMVLAPRPATRAQKPWTARTVLNRDAWRSVASAWEVQSLALRSRGENFRLSLGLKNTRPNWCGLTDYRVEDADGKPLASEHIKGGEWIWPQKSWEESVAFRAPRTAARVLVQVVSDGWECPGIELPLDFK